MKVRTLPRMLMPVILLLFSAYSALAQSKPAAGTGSAAQVEPVMKTYLIERDIPGIGTFTPATLKDISKKSCSVLETMGPGIQWLHSYVTGNKLFCVYKAENEDLLREHAKRGGFPITTIREIFTTISPATAK